MSFDATEKLKLWVRAGGICAICKAYLLESGLSGREVTCGELAHIIGRKNSDRSPRGVHVLPEDERDTADNAVLLCESCHGEIDNLKQVDLFDVEKVMSLKAAHEAFVRDVTSRSSDARTAVLRVRGLVRGATDDLTQEAAVQAIFACTDRFPSFPFADRVGVEIDLRGIAGEREADDGYYAAAARKIDEVIERTLRPVVLEGHVGHLSVFALARLPLLVHLGSRLDDTLPTDVFQRHRQGETWAWPPGGQKVGFRHRPDHVSEGTADEAVLIVNASGTIHAVELPESVAALPRFVIEPVNEVPHVDTIMSRDTLGSFERALRHLLAEIEAMNKEIRTIHVFAAVPVSAAVVLGRSVGWGIHPSLVVYDRSNDRYRPALEVTAP